MPLALRHLKLSHYRSWRSLSLGLSGAPVVLTGPNGAGKTNLLEAVSMLVPGRGLRGAGPGEIARQPEALGWSLTAALDTPDGAHAIWTGAQGAERRTAKLDDKPVPLTHLGRAARALWLTPALDRVFVEGPGERRRFLDRIALSFFPDHAGAALAYDKAMRERNRLFRDQITDPLWHDALERRMAGAGAAMARHRARALERLLAAMPADGPFPAATGAIEGGGPAEEAALADTLAASRALDAQAGRALTGPHRADLRITYAAKAMPAELCSTGEQKALLVGLILANARALTEDGLPPLLLLDEIAAHFDAARRAQLFDAICALGAQAFMTGTEASLFAEMGARAQWFSVTESAGLSCLEPGR